MIPVYQPYLNKQILSYAHDALDSTWISSTGKYLTLAEEKLKELLKVKYIILTNNGTTATHLVSCGLEDFIYRNTKETFTDLLVPDNVYVAAWNAFIYNKRFNLIPISSNIETWNIDLNLLHKNLFSSISGDEFPFLIKERTKSILITHNLGNIVNVPDLKNKYPHTIFVEDCCEGLFGIYNNKYAGTESLLSSFSFYGNKTITSGEGGAVATNDDYLYEYLLCLRGQGQSKTKFKHNLLGYNYRMTNIEASILYGQLCALDEITEKKLDIFSTYDSKFCQIPEISLQSLAEGTVPANWMYGIRIIKEDTNYEKAFKFFQDNGIEIRPMFYPMSAHQHLKKYAITANEENSKILNEQCIILPSYPSLSSEEQDYIISKVLEYCSM